MLPCGPASRMMSRGAAGRWSITWGHGDKRATEYDMHNERRNPCPITAIFECHGVGRVVGLAWRRRFQAAPPSGHPQYCVGMTPIEELILDRLRSAKAERWCGTQKQRHEWRKIWRIEVYFLERLIEEHTLLL